MPVLKQNMEAAVTVETHRDALIAEFDRVRRTTETLCEPLAIDDYQIQSIVQTSPPKWHIAHVTWFFEAFVLPHFMSGYKPFHPRYDFLFNSYYYTQGDMHPRSKRGLLSRPTVEEIYQYRTYVNDRMRELIDSVDDAEWEALAFRVTLGLNHEQQHQELLLMDIKHNFSVNPLKPAYRDNLKLPRGECRPVRWLERAGGIRELNPHEPVCHLSFYEADDYARRVGKRLPLGCELETLLAQQSVVSRLQSCHIEVS